MNKEVRGFSFTDLSDEEAYRKAKDWFFEITRACPGSRIARNPQTGKCALWVAVRPGEDWEKGEMLEVLVVYKAASGFVTHFPAPHTLPSNNLAPGRQHDSAKTVIAYIRDLLLASGWEVAA